MSKGNMSDQKIDYFSLNAKLCRLVQANPCMYDRSSPNYLKKEYVERAWANIAREVKDSVGSCKERWRNIRTAFARSVNIYKTPTGPNRHKRYYLHDELQFLTKHIAPGLPSLPLRILSPTELEENHDNSQQSVDETYDNCIYQITIDPSSTPPPTQFEEDSVSTPEPEYTDPSPSSPVKKRKVMNTEDLSIDLAKMHRNTDPDSEFLNSLLPELKAMNARQKIVFKGKIYRALEEVFADTKDFPSKIATSPSIPMSTQTIGTKTANKNIGVKLASGSVLNNSTDPEQSDVITLNSAHNVSVAMISLNQNGYNIKQEAISVDLDD